MRLTPAELEFLDRRRRLTRLWPLVGGLLLLVIASLVGWLLWRNPLLINPWVVMAGLEARSIPGSMLLLMAGILPIMTLMTLLLLVLLVLSLFASFHNERKHMRIVEKVIDPEGASDDR